MRRAFLAIAVLTLAATAATVAFEILRDRDYRAPLARGDDALRSDLTLPAVEAYSVAVALRPDAMLPRLRRGEAYQRRGDLEAAIHGFWARADRGATAVPPRE